MCAKISTTNHLPDDIVWSYSKLTTYEHCPLAFKLQYLDRCPQTNNAYAEYGTLCHELLEKWATGELAAFELGDQYRQGFDKTITHSFPPFPKGLGAKYFDAGIRYFDTFAGFGEHLEILASEKRFTTTVGGRPFVGIVDLLLSDPETGDIILMDHKSASLSSMKKKVAKQLRQLYLYAGFVRERHGTFPTRLILNLFREMEWINTAFDPTAFEEASAWAIDMIQMVEVEQDWLPCKLDYFCRFICSVAYHCPTHLEQEGW